MEKELIKEIIWARRKNSGMLLIEDERQLSYMEIVLSRQTPIKPDFHSLGDYIGLNYCKICGKTVFKEDNYCKSCGQKLDWD